MTSQHIDPKFEVWAIAEAFPHVLNLVVIACVINQSQGHWFMSNALITCINLKQTMEAKMGQVVDVTNVLNPFDFKVFLFKKNGVSVVKVIKTCLCFLILYDLYQFHNMFAFMFDPCFKSLQVLESYVGWGNVIHLTIEYDAKAVIH